MPLTLAQVESIHQVIQSAVQRAGGNWRQSFQIEVRRITLILNETEVVLQKID